MLHLRHGPDLVDWIRALLFDFGVWMLSGISLTDELQGTDFVCLRHSVGLVLPFHPQAWSLADDFAPDPGAGIKIKVGLNMSITN